MDMQYLLPAAATLTAGFASVALAGLKTYLDERTHASRLSRVVGALQRVAGDVSQQLATLPPGASITQVRERAIASAVTDLRTDMPVVLKQLGASDARLATMLSGILTEGIASPAMVVAPLRLTDTAPPGPIATVLGLLMLCAVGVSACTSAPTATNVTAAVTASVSQAQAGVQAAINLYGVAKGIGEVAAMVDPAIGVVVTGITAVADPMVARAQAALNVASVDVAAIEALTVQITALANALTVRAAPGVTVIPTAPPSGG